MKLAIVLVFIFNLYYTLPKVTTFIGLDQPLSVFKANSYSSNTQKLKYSLTLSRGIITRRIIIINYKNNYVLFLTVFRLSGVFLKLAYRALH